MSWAHISRHFERECKFCGIRFTTSIPKQVYCSNPCKCLYHKRGGSVIYLDDVQYQHTPRYKVAIPRPARPRKPPRQPVPKPERCPQCGSPRIITRRNGKQPVQHFWQECHWCGLQGKHATAPSGMGRGGWLKLIEQSIRNWNDDS